MLILKFKVMLFKMIKKMMFRMMNIAISYLMPALMIIEMMMMIGIIRPHQLLKLLIIISKMMTKMMSLL